MTRRPTHYSSNLTEFPKPFPRFATWKDAFLLRRGNEKHQDPFVWMGALQVRYLWWFQEPMGEGSSWLHAWDCIHGWISTPAPEA